MKKDNSIVQEPKFSIPDVQTHYIKSKFVDQEYEIFVAMPIVHDDETENFPVLYCLDADFFYPKDLTGMMQLTGEDAYGNQCTSP